MNGLAALLVFLTASVAWAGGTAWERALLRAMSSPDLTFRARRCGRFLVSELTHAPRGRFLQLHAFEVGCSEMDLPGGYTAERVPAGMKIWRDTYLVAQLITQTVQPVPAKLLVVDRRPGWETRYESGIQILELHPARRR